jgi:hypothetical protein
MAVLRIALSSMGACVLWTACGEPAHAAVWTTGVKPTSSVTLAGGHVAWLTPRRDGAIALYQGRAKGRAKRVQVFAKPAPPPGASGATYGGGAFAGSRSRIALELAVIPESSKVSEASEWPSNFFSGEPGSPLASDGQCGFDPRSGLGRTDVSGDIVARVRCDGSADTREDGASGSPFAFGSQVQAVRVSGRYVATLEGFYDYASPNSALDVVVYDRAAGHEAYRIPSASLPAVPYELSIQADGKVVFAYRKSSAKYPTVAWASVAAPSPHTVPLAKHSGYGFQIANDHVAFSRNRKRSQGGGGEVVIATLDGRARIIATDAARSGKDFDGRRVTYVRRGCHRYSVVRRAVTGARSERRCRKR